MSFEMVGRPEEGVRTVKEWELWSYDKANLAFSINPFPPYSQYEKTQEGSMAMGEPLL